MGKNNFRLLVAAFVVAAVVTLGSYAGMSNPFTSPSISALGLSDNDQPLTGSAFEKATEAALRYTGGGVVTDTEIGDDGAAYGVEVRLPDGRQVEINLDANFNVIGQEIDDDGPDDDDDD
jgi:hypothetical protein